MWGRGAENEIGYKGGRKENWGTVEIRVIERLAKKGECGRRKVERRRGKWGRRYEVGISGRVKLSALTLIQILFHNIL